MDIAVEIVFRSQLFCYQYQPLHGVVRILKNPRTQEQPFNVIAAIKIDGEIDYFLHSERRALYIIAFPAHAISAIKNAYIGQQYFKQGNATAILGVSVANAIAGIAQTLIVIFAIAAAAGTADIVFGGIGEDG